MDTFIEDGSLELVCEALCSGFRACAAGREAEVIAELAKLPVPADLSAHKQVRKGHRRSQAGTQRSQAGTQRSQTGTDRYIEVTEVADRYR